MDLIYLILVLVNCNNPGLKMPHVLILRYLIQSHSYIPGMIQFSKYFWGHCISWGYYCRNDFIQYDMFLMRLKLIM